MNADFLAEMDPFAWEPSAASRIDGLGGGQRLRDGSYAFHTPYLAAPAGLATFSINFVNLQATRGTLIVEIFGGGVADRRQLRMRTLSLAELAAAGGGIEISLPSDRGETYAVAGHIYDDSDARADGATVQIVVVRGSKRSAAQMQAAGMVRVARLAGIDLPSFQHPSSQTWSLPQLDEKPFLSAVADLGLEPRTSCWGAAFVYHALRYQFGSLDGYTGIGMGDHFEELVQGLQTLGAHVHPAGAHVHPAAQIAALPSPPHDYDFAWVIANEPEASPAALLATALRLAGQVRAGGIVVLVFPWEHSRMPLESCPVSKRGDIEILALKLLAQGHGVAQLKFRAGDRRFAPGTRTPFALLFHRAP